MSSVSSPVDRGLRTVTAVVALLVLGMAIPVAAGQGSPPTTALTGPIDDADQGPPAGFSQSCAPAGGQVIDDPEVPDGEFVFVGGGWGHGAGMSQYGAQGAGRLGCSAEQILTTYFPGTSVGPVAQPEPIVIGLGADLTATDIAAEADPIPWQLCHYQTGDCEDLPETQPTGAVWTVQVLGNATYRITDAGGRVVFEGGDHEQNLRALLSTTGEENRRAGVSTTGHVYRWGVLQIDSVLADPAVAFMTLEIPTMDLYLRGLAEVPANWPAASLHAQAIAGRSYALHRIQNLGIREECRCHLLSTTADQNYEGYDYESADARAGANWRGAVEATSGVGLLYDGAVVETFYSSSHGGISESTEFVFGTALPYSRPVDDSRWDLASTNPRRRWAQAVTAAELGGAFGVGQATTVELAEPRGAGGRVGSPSRGYGGMKVTGTTGSITVAGDQVRQQLGLFSTLFEVRGDGPTGPTESPTEPTEPAPPATQVVRTAAADRVATAIEVSRHGWDSAPSVVLAAAETFPDALAGVRLAASLEAPLLLTGATGLPDAVAEELQRLDAATVWILGGTSAVSGRVADDLRGLGLSTRRLSGASRYETAASIAVASAIQTDEVTLALGTDWPDAVSASSLAALLDGPPILLVESDQVPAATVGALRDLDAGRVTIVGGTAVVSQAVVTQLTDLDLDVTRLSGPDRYSSSVAVAEAALQRRTGTVPLIVASGENFPDALSAGALAARQAGVLILVPSQSLPQGHPSRDFIEQRNDRLGDGVVVGGTKVISATVEEQLRALLAD